MIAGRLDRLITIQRKTLTSSDSGEPTESWETIVARRWASYRPVKGDEGFTGKQIVGREDVEFRVRWSNNVSDVSQNDRVIYPALADIAPEDVPAARNIYDVIAVHEIGRREGILIVARRRSDVTP